MTIRQEVRITPDRVVLNDMVLPTESQGIDMLTEIYRGRVNDYPRFYKMDELCRLGFIASELLLEADGDRHQDSDDRAVILFNSSSSLCNDRKYQATIQQTDNYFPSPSLFVYTLPNIVTGEIAIRNGWHGETAFYVLDHCDDRLIRVTLEATFLDATTRSALCGWLDCEGPDRFEAFVQLIEK